MSDIYAALASFAQTWGLLLFFFGFLGVVAYAYWPSKKRKKDFEEASKIPLKED